MKSVLSIYALAAFTLVSQSAHASADEVILCGTLRTNDSCDVDVCRVTLQTRDNKFIGVGALNGTSLGHEQDLYIAGVAQFVNQNVCIQGQVSEDLTYISSGVLTDAE